MEGLKELRYLLRLVYAALVETAAFVGAGFGLLGLVRNALAGPLMIGLAWMLLPWANEYFRRARDEYHASAGRRW